MDTQALYDRLRTDTEGRGQDPDLEMVVYVADVLRTVPHETVPVVMTCGTAEENLANNRQMAATLTKQGYTARLVEVPDAHNYVAWRDAFDPALTELLRATWSG